MPKTTMIAHVQNDRDDETMFVLFSTLAPHPNKRRASGRVSVTLGPPPVSRNRHFAPRFYFFLFNQLALLTLLFLSLSLD